MSFTTQEQLREGFEHARRAKEALDSMISSEFLPVLQTVTGNPNLEVRSHGGAPLTNGALVMLQIPWKLGETLEHNSALCREKDPKTLLSLCPACRIVDEVRADMWHESAHITEKTFQDMGTWRIWEIIERTFKDVLDTLPEAKRNELRSNCIKARSSLQALSVIDPWVMTTWNAIEDIYVNRRLYKARPGTEPGMQATTRQSFIEVTFKRGPDMDAVMVPYVMGHGVDDAEVRSYFGPDHLPLFDDAEIQAILDDLPAECNIDKRIELSIKLLAAIRKYGFLPRPTDSLVPPPPPPPPPSEEAEPEPEQGEQAEGESEGEGGSDDESDEADDQDGDSQADDDQASDGKSDESEADSDEGEGEADESDEADDQAGDGEGEGEDDDESSEADDQAGDGGAKGGADESDESEAAGPTDEEIRQAVEELIQMMEEAMGHGAQEQSTPEQQDIIEKAIAQADFDEPSFFVDGLKLIPTSQFNRGTPVTNFRPEEGIIAAPLSHLRVVLAENKRSNMTRDLRRGPRLDGRHLHRAGADDYRIFGRKDRPKGRDWFVVVGVDFTSSNNNNGALGPVKEIALSTGEMLARLGIKFVMEAHTGDRSTFGGPYNLVHAQIKQVNEPWNEKIYDKINKLHGVGSNLDGHSMERYRKLAERERATDKLVMFVTDGKMHGDQEEGRILTRNIDLCKRLGIHLLAVSYKNMTPQSLGFETVQFDGMQDLHKVVEALDQLITR